MLCEAFGLKRAPAGALAILGPKSMSRVAVFVDAGYLFAQGSAALNGSKVSRTQTILNETAVVAELISVAQSKSGNAPFLRVYWYDGALGSRGITAEQSVIANTDFVKLRLGFMNSRGQQKGVDSFIVTDLIELSRNHAISDALLLSGDEDVRIGVSIAQSFGVRVHLLGIIPSRGSQSKQLMQEADTTTEWDKATVAKFLAVKTPVVVPPASGTVIAATAAVATASAVVATSAAPDPADLALLEKVALDLSATQDAKAVTALKAFWVTQSGVPYESDGRLLASSRAALTRDLTQTEKRYVRRKFIEAVKAKP